MSLESLYALVTEAILRSDALPDPAAPEAAQAHLEVSILEERIAAELPASHPEGGVARRGAVRAAVAAGQPKRARALAQRFLAEDDAPRELREAIRQLCEPAAGPATETSRGGGDTRCATTFREVGYRDLAPDWTLRWTGEHRRGLSETSQTVRAITDHEYAILGSVIVRCAPGGDPVALSDQHKLLLGRLLLDPGALVSTDELMEALWDAVPGVSSRNAVQVAVRALRGLLGDTDRVHRVIVAGGDAYRLVVDDALRIDAERFKRLAQRGHDIVEDLPAAAGAMLTEALSMWRGELLGELGDRRWVVGHARELASVRDQVEVDLTEVRLALGEHSELEGALRLQIAQNPHDEVRRGQLVRALHRAGRWAEAQVAYLAAYRDLGAVGPVLRRIGEDVARGLPAETATPARVGAPSRLVGGGHPDRIVLCASLDPRGQSRCDLGLGTLSLFVDHHGGEPYHVTKDLLIATFPDVDAALAAAAAIAADGRMKAGIGVHVGRCVQLGESLTGPGPAHCEVLARVAHPGQVFVSAAARSRAASETDLTDLGAQRFFDLSPGDHVFELVPGRGDRRFPPPQTLSRLPNNLPVQMTRFVGRGAELARLAPVVGAGNVVILTGPGGCGKTRLALQLAAGHAQAFADGVWFVEFAELDAGADVEAVAAVVADRLGAHALPGETQLDGLARHLSDRVALLLIDGCEHVDRACVELVGRLRAGCPGLGVLATSRRAMRIDGGHVLHVSSMAVDAEAQHGLPSDAVQLLLERAGPLPREAGRDDTVAEAARICRALDGLPLAIELAAAQVPPRGLSGVAVEVEAMMRGEQGLAQFASGDPARPDRQRTIESAIDWSYRLLSDREQRMLRRLAVFRGTFGMVEAQRATELGAGDVGSIKSLVDRSIVAVAPPVNGMRLRLVEPIRTFSLELLARAGELEAAREAHAAVYLALAIDAAPRLFGPNEQDVLRLLEADHDNLRAALAWHVDQSDGRSALRLVSALWWLWFSLGHVEEGCEWVRRALEIGDEPSPERVRALRVGSHLAWWSGRRDECNAHNLALEECARAIGDEWGLAWATMGFGAIAVFRDLGKALSLLEESKRRFDALGRTWEAGYALNLIGGACWFSGDEAAAGKAFEEAVEIFGEIGQPSILASVGRCAGLMAATCGSPARGTALCTDALRLSEAINDRAGSAQALNFLAAISRHADQPRVAIVRHAEALRLAREVGDVWATCWALDGIAGAARETGQPEIAARLHAKSARIAARSWHPPSPRGRALREDEVDGLRAELGIVDFEQAIAEGEAMSVAEAVSCALAFASRPL